MNERASLGLSAWFRRTGFAVGRLKTGTPPRLSAKTIDWRGLDMQAAGRVMNIDALDNQCVSIDLSANLH